MKIMNINLSFTVYPVLTRVQVGDFGVLCIVTKNGNPYCWDLALRDSFAVGDRRKLWQTVQKLFLERRDPSSRFGHFQVNGVKV